MVLFDLQRMKSKAKVARKYKLSWEQIDHISKNNKLEDCRITQYDAVQAMHRLNASMMHIQQEVLESITPEQIAGANLAQKSITVGILADKTKQYDAHLSGTMDTTPILVDYNSREEILDRIKGLQKRMGHNAIEAELVEIEDIVPGDREEEDPQLDLFPPEDVEESSGKGIPDLGGTEVLQQSPVGTLRRRTGKEPRRPHTGYQGPEKVDG